MQHSTDAVQVITVHRVKLQQDCNLTCPSNCMAYYTCCKIATTVCKRICNTAVCLDTATQCRTLLMTWQHKIYAVSVCMVCRTQLPVKSPRFRGQMSKVTAQELWHRQSSNSDAFPAAVSGSGSSGLWRPRRQQSRRSPLRLA